MPCGSAKPVTKIDLVAQPFPEINFDLSTFKLKFDNVAGRFTQSKGVDVASNIGNDAKISNLVEEEKKLQKLIQQKLRKVEELDDKIKEITGKYEELKRIVEIDLQEKEYVDELYQSHIEKTKILKKEDQI